MSEKGYVSIWRKSFEHEWYFSEPFTRWQAWMDLIMIANFRKSSVFIRGNYIEVDRGQVLAGREFLANRWRWSGSKVKRFLDLLENKMQQIEQKKNNVTNLVTIINYDKYQADDQQTTSRRTTDEQQTTSGRTADGQQTDTLNNNNNNNNNNKSNKRHADARRIEEVEKILKLHPKIIKPTKSKVEIFSVIEKMVAGGQEFDAAVTYLKNKTGCYAEAVNDWNHRSRKFVIGSVNWFADGCYDENPADWKRDKFDGLTLEEADKLRRDEASRKSTEL